MLPIKLKLNAWDSPLVCCVPWGVISWGVYRAGILSACLPGVQTRVADVSNCKECLGDKTPRAPRTWGEKLGRVPGLLNHQS